MTRKYPTARPLPRWERSRICRPGFGEHYPDRIAGVTALLRHLIYEEGGSYELRGARFTAR
jgi:hypothetical protein